MADETVEVKIKSTFDGHGADQATKKLGLLDGVMVGLGTTAIQLGGRALGALKQGLIDSVNEAAEAERNLAQLDAVLESTGHAAGLTSDELQAMAGRFAELTTFEDDAVLAMQNVLLTFTQVRGEAFEPATQAILDMSTALGTDLQSSAIQVGKALNDPKIGLTALQRVGVTFSEEQKKVITALHSTGQTAEAQRLIIEELNREFGGSAAAAADTYAGKMEKLGNEFGEVKEAIGMSLIPVLEDLAETVSPLVKDFAEFITLINEMERGVEGGTVDIDVYNRELVESGNLLGLFGDGVLHVGDALFSQEERQQAMTAALEASQRKYDALNESVASYDQALLAAGEQTGEMTDGTVALSGAYDNMIGVAKRASEASEEYGNTYPEAQAKAEEFRRKVDEIKLALLGLSTTSDESKRAHVEMWVEARTKAEETKTATDNYQTSLDGISTWFNGPGDNLTIHTEDQEVQDTIDLIGRIPREVNVNVNVNQPHEEGEGGLPGGRQHGGPVAAGGSYVVGEAGPELFVPNQSGTIVPNGALGGGGNTYNLTVVTTVGPRRVIDDFALMEAMG